VPGSVQHARPVAARQRADVRPPPGPRPPAPGVPARARARAAAGGAGPRGRRARRAQRRPAAGRAGVPAAAGEPGGARPNPYPMSCVGLGRPRTRPWALGVPVLAARLWDPASAVISAASRRGQRHLHGQAAWLREPCARARARPADAATGVQGGRSGRRSRGVGQEVGLHSRVARKGCEPARARAGGAGRAAAGRAGGHPAVHLPVHAGRHGPRPPGRPPAHRRGDQQRRGARARPCLTLYPNPGATCGQAVSDALSFREAHRVCS